MSKGPWRIRGNFRDPNTISFLTPIFSYQEITYANFCEADLALNHFVARGQKYNFEGNLDLVNENDDIIYLFERNPHNHGARMLLIETNMDLKDVAKVYNHGYNLKKNIDFYFRLSPDGMTTGQLYMFNYIVSVIHNANLYVDGPTLITPIHEGNSDSLYNIVMEGKEITSDILGNALRAVAKAKNKPFV